MSEYTVKFYKNSKTHHVPLIPFIDGLPSKNQQKIVKYIDYLCENEGYIEEPKSKHIIGKIRELRVDFAKNRYRIFYFTFIRKTIVLLHSFEKHSEKTPMKEISIALQNYNDVIQNPHLYE